MFKSPSGEGGGGGGGGGHSNLQVPGQTPLECNSCTCVIRMDSPDRPLFISHQLGRDTHIECISTYLFPRLPLGLLA